MMILRILTALVLSVLPAAAEGLSVRCLSLSPGEFPPCFIDGKDGFVPLTFSTIQPTEPIEVPRKSPLPIYRLADGADGGQVHSVAAKVALPGDAGGILLIGMASGGKVRFVALEDDIKSAGSKDWMLINASSKPIAFKVGKQGTPVRIEPGKSKLQRIRADDEKGAAVMAQALFGQEAKLVYSTYWPIFADKRSVVLFIEDNGKIKVKRITDRVGKEAEE